MKLGSISKNVARFEAVNESNDGGKSLRESGKQDYGQMELVIQDEEELDDLRVGNVYTVSIEDLEETEVAGK